MFSNILKKTRKIVTLGVLLIWIFSSCKKTDNDEEQGAPIRPTTATSNKYVTTLFEYTPAPGQFTNTDLGNSVGANAILGSKDNTVSLGAWGGSIVLGFDHTVLNRTATDDIIIYGNAFSSFAEPGIIFVMQDENGNGKPDDQWYELTGSEFNKTGYLRNYSVTYNRPDSVAGDIKWTDNQGRSGVVRKNAFHTQAYYPNWITANQYTLTGSLLPTTNIDDSNPAYVVSTSFDGGYADNTQGGDSIDIDDAVDANGSKIILKGIDFIKIQTAIQYNLGASGELSTEVSGVADKSIIP